jgi:hypothetical protein
LEVVLEKALRRLEVVAVVVLPKQEMQTVKVTVATEFRLALLVQG